MPIAPIIKKMDIYKYIVKFEELKRFFGEMSVPTLIDLLMCNTCYAVYDRYKGLKQWELTWEQFLTELTVIDDEEACWDSLKQKEAQEGNCCPVSGNGGKRALVSNKKQKNALIDCAEEF